MDIKDIKVLLDLSDRGSRTIYDSSLLVSNGLVEKVWIQSTETHPDSSVYTISPKGRVYLKMLEDVPLPVPEVKWVNPKTGETYSE